MRFSSSSLSPLLRFRVSPAKLQHKLAPACEKLEVFFASKDGIDVYVLVAALFNKSSRSQ